MAASMQFNEWVDGTGTGAGCVNKATGAGNGNIRFRATNSAVDDNTNRIVKPAAGQQARSMEKYLRMRAIGTFTQISGQRYWMTGGGFTIGGQAAAGTKLWARTTNPSSWATPVVRTDDASCTDATTFTSVAPKSLGSQTVVTPGDVGDFLVLHLAIDSTVGPGVFDGAPVPNFGWDEV